MVELYVAFMLYIAFQEVFFVFLILEKNTFLYIGRVLALVREGNETAIILRDGSVMATGFQPMTIARRSEEFIKNGKKLASKVKKEGDKK